MKNHTFVRLMYKLLLLLICTISVGFLCAQNGPLIFEKISNKEGLNQNSIFSIVQDKSGFIWLGTPNGLIKYDGSSFHSYVSHPGDSTSLLSNVVMKVFEDEQEKIWLGTLNGLCFFQPDKNQFVWVNDFNDLLPERTTTFNQIIERKNKELWVATSSGLFELQQNNSATSFQVRKITQTVSGKQLFLNGTILTDLFELPDSSVFITTNNGLYHVKKNNIGEVILLHTFHMQNNEPININTIFRDQEGLFWLGGNNGIFFMSLENKNGQYRYNWEAKPRYLRDSSKLYHSTINTIFQDDIGNVLVGTVRDGLFRFLQREESVEQYLPSSDQSASISSEYINDITMDRSGVIWIATAHGGLNKIDPNRKLFFNLKQRANSKGLSSNLVNGMIQDYKGRLWVGTFKNGLNISRQAFSYSTIYQTEFDHYLKDIQVNCFYETAEKLVLIGTSKGLKIYDLKNEEFVALPDNHPLHTYSSQLNIGALLQVGKDFWIGSHRGLSKITVPSSSIDLVTGNFDYGLHESSEYFEFQISNVNVNVIMNDPSTGLWVGTRSGLYCLKNESENNAFEVFRYDKKNTKSISHNNIFSIFKDQQKNAIWIGTFGGGLNRILFNKKQQVAGFERFTKRDGLADNAIYSILQDEKGFLWLSTDEGISKFDSKTRQVITYNMEDGLSANNFRKNSSLALGNGQLLMGGLNGITVFDPLQISENPYPPVPVISQLKLLNEPIYPNEPFQGKIILQSPIYKTEEIKLPHYLNQITFEFAAMHYAAPKKNFFKYILEGVDRDWITVDHTQRFASYSQLQPGEYTFKLKSYNGDGLESEQVKTMKVIIRKPFYKSNLAYFIYCLVSGMIFFFISRHIRNLNQLRIRVEEEEREIQRIKEINEAKLTFFTDVSHEFRTPLTLIISPLEQILQDDKLHPELKNRISNINKNGQKLLNLTNTLIDFRKVGQGKLTLEVTHQNLAVFIRETASAFQDYASDKNINFRVDLPSEPVFAWFDPNVLERVLFNLITNAFKYTSDYGIVGVILELENKGTAVIKVVDSGKGMTPDEAKNVFQRYFHGKEKKSLFGSSGIGLSLVTKLIDLHKAKIDVQSEVGKGTEFKIYLPIARSVYAEEIVMESEQTLSEVQEISPVKVQTTTTTNTNPSVNKDFNFSVKDQTLLVVEDNPDIQQLIEDIFKSDFKIIRANNGQQGFELAIQTSPDIIISDVMMPVMDGFELSAQLKNDIRTSHIPLVLLTALNDYESKKMGFKGGSDVYISKPFSPELLAMQINNLLETKQKEAIYRKTRFLMKPTNVPIRTREEEFLSSVMEYIELEYASDSLSVEDLAKHMNMSYIQFYRKFKAVTGVNAKEYIRTYRLNKAAYILRHAPGRTVREVMYSVGFSSQSHFTNAFKKEFGCTPSEYKKKD